MSKRHGFWETNWDFTGIGLVILNEFIIPIFRIIIYSLFDEIFTKFDWPKILDEQKRKTYVIYAYEMEEKVNNK